MYIIPQGSFHWTKTTAVGAVFDTGVLLSSGFDRGNIVTHTQHSVIFLSFRALEYFINNLTGILLVPEKKLKKEAKRIDLG